MNGLNRIIDGKDAECPIPWQVHLRIGDPNGGFSYFCGGTIIDEKTILTAAHCYDGMNLGRSDFFVTAGIINIVDQNAQNVFVASINLHPEYNRSIFNNDIAILKLKEPLTFNSKVRNACLPEDNFVPQGIAVASGWGLTGTRWNYGRATKLQVRLQVVLTLEMHGHTQISGMFTVTNYQKSLETEIGLLWLDVM